MPGRAGYRHWVDDTSGAIAPHPETASPEPWYPAELAPAPPLATVPLPSPEPLGTGEKTVRAAQVRVLARDFGPSGWSVWLSSGARWFGAARGGQTETAETAAGLREILAGRGRHR